MPTGWIPKPYAWHEYQSRPDRKVSLTLPEMSPRIPGSCTRADTAWEVELGFDPSDMRVRTFQQTDPHQRIIDPVVGADVEMWRYWRFTPWTARLADSSAPAV